MTWPRQWRKEEVHRGTSKEATVETDQEVDGSKGLFM